MSNPIAAAIAERRARVEELLAEILKLEQVEHLLGGAPAKSPRPKKARAAPVESPAAVHRALCPHGEKAKTKCRECRREYQNAWYAKKTGKPASKAPKTKSEPDPARWMAPPPTEGIPSLRDEASRAFGFGAGGSSSLLKNAILRRELEQEEAIVATPPGLIEVCRFCGTGVSGGAEACTRCHAKHFGRKRTGLPGAVRVSTSKEIAFVGPDPISRSLYRGQAEGRASAPPPPESSGGQLEP